MAQTPKSLSAAWWIEHLPGVWQVMGLNPVGDWLVFFHTRDWHKTNAIKITILVRFLANYYLK